MTFIILRYVLLFLLPFFLYGLWVIVARQRAHGHENDPNWTDWPFLFLSVAGFGLALISLFALGLTQGEEKSGTYIPPRVIDGEIRPGEVRR